MKPYILIAYISGGILLTILLATFLVLYITHVKEVGIKTFLYELLWFVIIIAAIAFYISMFMMFPGGVALLTFFAFVIGGLAVSEQ